MSAPLKYYNSGLRQYLWFRSHDVNIVKIHFEQNAGECEVANVLAVLQHYIQFLIFLFNEI